MSDHTTYNALGELAGRIVLECHRCGDPLVQRWNGGILRLPKNMTLHEETGEIRANCCTCNVALRIAAGTAAYLLLAPLTAGAGTAILTA